MTTYVYETIPQSPGESPERFEVRQSMKDAPLTHDPKSGKPVRRVMLGGYGVLMPAARAEPMRECQQTGCCCGQEGCCERN
ncbi:hypothetical protein DB347_21270 [Opitutaceae bacterium EW11]|nr:hypothetical protein DB347_21270 [Opitutaceae bacterium EW11]